MSSVLHTPLWLAGHLPHRGGDRLRHHRRFPCGLAEARWVRKLPISPLVGEMRGRAEGGARRNSASRSESPAR